MRSVVTAVAWSACLSVCWSRPCVLRQRMNRSECCFGCRLEWAEGTVRWVEGSLVLPMGQGTFWGTYSSGSRNRVLDGRGSSFLMGRGTFWGTFLLGLRNRLLDGRGCSSPMGRGTFGGTYLSGTLSIFNTVRKRAAAMRHLTTSTVSVCCDCYYAGSH